MKSAKEDRENHKAMRRFRGWMKLIRALERREQKYPEGFTKATMEKAAENLKNENIIAHFREAIRKAS